jgi:acetylglutamate kinase
MWKVWNKIMRKTAFVKVSGDLVSRKDVVDWIRDLAKKYYTVVCIGGGTHISEEFRKQGYKIKFGPLGREVGTFHERQLARDILEKNQAKIQDLLAKNKINATVIIPILDIGSVLCHINGDVFIQTAYLGFDKLFILTYADRFETKKKEFENLPKIKVIGFPK